jgi:hypothetical protein
MVILGRFQTQTLAFTARRSHSHPRQSQAVSLSPSFVSSVIQTPQRLSILSPPQCFRDPNPLWRQDRWKTVGISDSICCFNRTTAIRSGGSRTTEKGKTRFARPTCSSHDCTKRPLRNARIHDIMNTPQSAPARSPDLGKVRRMAAAGCTRSTASLCGAHKIARPSARISVPLPG